MRLIGKPYPQYFLLFSVIGILACLGLAQVLSRKKILGFLSILGMYSLQIYLVHMLAGVAARVVLLQLFHVENWIVQILLGMAAALTVPILLQKISTWINFPYLFELQRNKVIAPDPVVVTSALPEQDRK
jgi:peptidoglycan/LPS O-acetylase OafA/YrhL